MLQECEVGSHWEESSEGIVFRLDSGRNFHPARILPLSSKGMDKKTPELPCDALSIVSCRCYTTEQGIKDFSEFYQGIIDCFRRNETNFAFAIEGNDSQPVVIGNCSYDSGKEVKKIGFNNGLSRLLD